jgi:hypothetical protein
MISPDTPTDRTAAQPKWQPWVEVLLIFCVFFIHASWPVPDTNEPHYLSRAAHFWNADWCGSDLFLAAPEAHRAFYITFGWATQHLTLTQFAWAGRLLSWMLLAGGWYALVRATLGDAAQRRGWYAVLAAALFVFTNQWCQPAGEWVVGGFEAKGIAYACVFFALAAATRERWNVAAVMLGLATAMHALVGGWAALAVGFAALALGPSRPRIRATLPGLIASVTLAMCGIWPAVQLSRQASAATAAMASDIYVFERLGHHLVLQYFQFGHLMGYALLLVAWVALDRLTHRSPSLALLRRFVMVSLVIAAIGAFICLAWPLFGRETAAGLLRFYWFRLADAVLPVGFAIMAVCWIARLVEDGRPLAKWALLLAIAVSVLHLGTHVRARVEGVPPRGEAPLAGRQLDDWRDVCAWARDETPADARFITPRWAKTFRWHAERGEVGNWKDVPQGAAAIVAWRQRMDDLHTNDNPRAKKRWLTSHAWASPQPLARLAQRYDAPYLVTAAKPALPFHRLYRNRSFAVYDLTRPVGSMGLPQDGAAPAN